MSFIESGCTFVEVRVVNIAYLEGYIKGGSDESSEVIEGVLEAAPEVEDA